MTLLPALSRFTRSRLLRLFSLALVAVLCNEFLIFYLKKAQHVLLIADTHLLGRRRGHWFDKLRREWQMHRSYVSAVSLLRPNAIFFLGDLLDEGAYSMPDEFAGYVERFRQLFGPAATGVAVDVHALAGNHDLGFHYEIAPPRVEWFAKAFARERLVDVVSVGDIRFVLITSMAMHGDGCRLCYEAQKQLEEMATDFDCARRPTDCKRNPSSFAKLLPYSQPILLQHFPLFRPNDSVCERDEDFDHFDKTRNEAFRPQWECLDERSSHLLVRKLRPRVAFAGHTHRGCKRRWSSSNASFWEYTLNSFSWRNGNSPTFLLLTATADDYTVSTCYLPQETTVLTVYALTSAVVLMFILRRLLSLAYGWIQRSRYELPTTKVHKQS